MSLNIQVCGEERDLLDVTIDTEGRNITLILDGECDTVQFDLDVLIDAIPKQEIANTLLGNKS